MDDLISRQAAIDIAEKAFIRGLLATPDLRRLPSAQPPHSGRRVYQAGYADGFEAAQSERKKGKWIMLDKGLIVTSYKCSECGRTVRDDTGYDVSKDYPFCHCGADMREDTDDQSK